MRQHSEFVGECCGAEVCSETPTLTCPKCKRSFRVWWPADYVPDPTIKVVEA